MQIVIDIPEEVFNEIVSADDTSHLSRAFLNGSYLYFKEALQNGSPLPKGHGRLIDVNKLEYTCNSDECGMLTGCNHCQYHIITEDELDNAPTIIEADKESEDKIIEKQNTGWYIGHGMFNDRFFCCCGFVKIMDSSMYEWKYCPVCGRTKIVESQESEG